MTHLDLVSPYSVLIACSSAVVALMFGNGVIGILLATSFLYIVIRQIKILFKLWKVHKKVCIVTFSMIATEYMSIICLGVSEYNCYFVLMFFAYIASVITFINYWDTVRNIFKEFNKPTSD